MSEHNKDLREKFAKADEGSSGGRAERKGRANLKVIEYDDPGIDAETKAAMDRVMEKIDQDPDSHEAVISFGQEPLVRLGAVAADMIRTQARFSDQVNVLRDAVDGMDSKFSELNLGKLSDAVASVMKGAKYGTKKGIKAVGHAFKSGWGALTGANKKLAEDEKLVEDMTARLPELYMEMNKLVKNLDDAEKGLKEVYESARKLGQARVDATRELNIYLGASKEVLKRYDTIYIPEAQETLDQSQDPSDQAFLEDVIRRKENFIGQVNVLESSRAQGVNAAQQLRMMMETMEAQREKIKSIQHIGQNEWTAMLAAAGISASTLKVAQTIKKADDFGDRVHDQTMDMMGQAHQMTLESKSRGTVDPTKILEGMQKMKGMIEAEAEASRNRLRALEQSSHVMREATDKLIEAADVSKRARLLESGQEARKTAPQPPADGEGPAPAPSVNDNLAPAPAPAVSTPAPRRRGGAAGPKR